MFKKRSIFYIFLFFILLKPYYSHGKIPSEESVKPVVNPDEVDCVGPDFPEIEKANKLLRDFRKKFAIPGLSIAISYKEKLVYEASCGWADMEKRVKLTPFHLMRVASVSKTITALAIMRLVEDKKLNLDDDVFGENGILGSKYGEPKYKKKSVSVTVRNLLEHTSGGWGNNRYDPMFRLIFKDEDQMIKQTLALYPLYYEPGKVFVYSNFGYYILGRIIEKITGDSYEHFTAEKILKPSGAFRMRVGGTTFADDEVKYYPKTSKSYYNPYVLNPAHMDSFGGWLATPIDLLKILARTDYYSDVRDILKNDTINEMTKPSDAFRYYAKGWYHSGEGDWWHTGSMPGTYSIIIRGANRYNAVVEMNCRPYYRAFRESLDKLIVSLTECINDFDDGDDL